jgi:SAM-dependent methyltransferase
MDPREYSHMFDEEERHWWYAGMRAIALSLLPPDSLPPSSRVVDVGCGTGFNLGWLKQRYGALVIGLDFSPIALDFSRRRGERDLVRADASSLPFAGNMYDLVISFDVVTHLKNEPGRAAALSEFLRVLKPGGRLVLRVPAYRFLRSSHDKAVMAYHRYGRRELKTAIEAAGFVVRRLTGANTILFPVAVLWRLLKKAGVASDESDVGARTRGGDGLNRVLMEILKIEAAILRRFSFVFGLSLFVLAVKPGSIDESGGNG